MKIEQFNKLKEKIATKQSEVDNAKGAYSNALQDLKKTFGVKTAKEAKALLKTKEKERDKAEEAFNEKSQAFQEKYKDELGI